MLKEMLLGSVDLRMAFAVWMRNVTMYRRTWKLGLLPNFFEPVLYLVGMGIGLGYYIQRGDDGSLGEAGYLALIGPGLMASSAMNGASFEASWNMFVKMTFGRIYAGYLTTPCEIEDVQLGELLWGVTRALIYGMGFLSVVLVLTLLGYPIVTSWAVLLTPFAMVLTGLAFGLIGQLFTSYIQLIDLYSWYWTLFLTPLFLFSGIFFPVDRFAGMEEIAWCTPLFHCVRMMRALCQGPFGMEFWTSVVWLLVFCALLQRLVPSRLRKRFKS
ncbi:MAG: ABC transporter permease [Planctomycetota bacterium]|nr:MAG: ABC transporter permease [Planctomycetota bacterium]